jgi:hypothetical protein
MVGVHNLCCRVGAPPWAPVSITLITGPANAGKAGAALDALRGHCTRGERPLLVVPTAADVEHYRRELDREGAGVGARVERFDGLLAETFHRAGVAGRALGELARGRLLAAALERSDDRKRPSPGGERRLARREPRPTPGVVRALAALVGELEVERVSPARLRAALDAWAAADPAHAPHARGLGDLFECYRGAQQRLRPARASPERRAARALDALRRAPALWGATPVVVYGFDDFTRLQLDAIETLGAVVDAPLTVSLTYEPGRVVFASRGDTFQRLLPLASEHRRLPPRADHYAPAARAALHHLERNLFELDPPAPVPGRAALRLLEGGGERGELELVAEAIVALMAGGVAPAEIAVAHRSPDTIAELLEEVFRARRIPFALRRRLSLARTATGRALLGLLKAAFAEEHDERGLNDLLAWLRAPGVLRQPGLADELELHARRAGTTSVARARALWESEHWPLDTLDRLREAAQRSPAALVECTSTELQRLGFVSALDEQALVTAQEALLELRELTGTAPELGPGPDELIALLRDLELVVGETSGANHETVAVLDPLALRARRVRALFLCGLQEGIFPAPARPQPYLSEEERHALAEASGLRLGAGGDSHHALARERYLLYAAISRPWELLALSWHTADDDGLPTPRSLFVDDICDLFADEPHGARTRRALGEVSPSVPPATADGWSMPPATADGWSVPPATADGWSVPPATADGWSVPPATADGWSVPPDPAPLRPSDVAVPKPIAPLSDPRVLAELDERRMWSASSMQSWAGCPVAWFVERLLSARDLEPEAEPLARGGLAHVALRQTFAGLREETGSARIVPANLPRARELLRAALEEHARERPLSTAPERVPGVRRRLEADLERYLEHAAECGARSEPGQQLDLAKGGPATVLEPTHLELPFGFPDAPDGLPPLDLGETVHVRGYIDRVDLAPAGEAVVYDYKSSSPTPPDRWLSGRSFQVALYMRAVEQLLGAPAVGGFYQPLSGRDLRARGLLAEGEGVALDCVRGDARPVTEARELVDAVLAAARQAALEARAGAIEPRPVTCGWGGGGCMYPSICRCER